MRLPRTLSVRLPRPGRADIACALVAVAAAGALALPAGGTEPRLAVVASHLNNPRKLFVAPGGAVYVAEAGAGGRDRCVGPSSDRSCVGLTGSIMRIDGADRHEVVVGLPSVAGTDGQRASGPTDVAVSGNGFDVLMQDAFVTASGGNSLGRDGAVAGDLVSTAAGMARPRVIADLAAFEAKHDPDHGAGPGPRLGDPAVDSDPYAFTSYRGGYAVVDAAGNDLLWVSPKGRISVLAVFPVRRLLLTAAERKRYGLPASTRMLAVQSVPTSVAVGPDGALYVGELTGVPFRPGTARVWRVASNGRLSVYASGFTTISDLAFSGADLLVLEFTTGDVTSAKRHGALIRLAPGGRRTTLVAAGLLDPTGIAVAGRSVYISNHGTYPGAGRGPYGEVVRLSV